MTDSIGEAEGIINGLSDGEGNKSEEGERLITIGDAEGVGSIIGLWDGEVFKPAVRVVDGEYASTEAVEVVDKLGVIDMLGLADTDGVGDADSDTDAVIETVGEGVAEAPGLALADGVVLGEGLAPGLPEGDGEEEALADAEGVDEALAEADGVVDMLGLAEGVGVKDMVGVGVTEASGGIALPVETVEPAAAFAAKNPPKPVNKVLINLRFSMLYLRK